MHIIATGVTKSIYIGQYAMPWTLTNYRMTSRQMAKLSNLSVGLQVTPVGTTMLNRETCKKSNQSTDIFPMIEHFS